MDGAVVGALVGVGFLTVVNISAAAFFFGKLSQKLDDVCRRVSKLENKLNNYRPGG